MLHAQYARETNPIQPSMSIAVVGCGPTGLYFLKNIVEVGSPNIVLTFFSATEKLGQGMPYDPSWVGSETLANIACEEIPDLVVPPHEWLAEQSDTWLAERGIRRDQIGPSLIPSRQILGEYFSAQFALLVEKARSRGVTVQYLMGVQVNDIEAITGARFELVFRETASSGPQRLGFDKVVIATGHEWPTEPPRFKRYLPSPWPISVLTSFDAKSIGIIGSSLSAVDVCLEIARRNGEFHRDFDGRLEFVPNGEAGDLRIVMHSRRGLLPSQRFHFEYPRIQVHQYMSEKEIRDHIAENGGYLSLDFLFDKSLKQAVAEKSASLHAQIANMDVESFVAFMYRRRQKHDQFDLLRQEYAVSFASIRNREPIFWKEILDDVAYTLNFYAKYLNQRDFLRARDRLMPLVSHVVAFLPQQSCEQLLALHDAGCLGHATISADWSLTEDPDTSKLQLSHISADGAQQSEPYDLIIDCRGQRPAPFEQFPFQTLCRQGLISPARIGSRREHAAPGDTDVMLVGGVDIDDEFRSIDLKGRRNNALFVLAGPHIHGLYPYHSGLPFCNEASKTVARAICELTEAA